MDRARLAAVIGVLAVIGLVAGAWKDAPHSWRLMRSQYATYDGYTPTRREESYGALVPIRMDILEFWRAWLQPHDRYYIQIPYEAFSPSADKKLVVRTVSHLFLLPATEATSLKDATVVLSWDADPGLLHLHFISQERAGLQVVFVSRISNGS